VNNTATACLPAPRDTYVPRNRSSVVFQCNTDGILCSDGAAFVQPGFWMYEANHTSGEIGAQACLPGLCIGSTSKGDTQCAAGRLQSPDNFLCGRCESHLYEWRDTCVHCGQSSAGWFILIVVVSFVLVLALHLLSKKQQNHNASTGQHSLSFTSIVRPFVPVVTYYMQVMIILVGPSEAAFGWLRLLNLQVTEVPFSRCVLPLRGWAKFDFSFGMQFVPFGEVLTIMIGHMAARGAAKYRDYLRTIVMLAVVMYTGITTTMLRSYICTSVADSYVLYFFPAIQCDDKQWIARLVPISLLVALYTVGFPALIVYMAKRRECKQHADQFEFVDILTSAFRPGVRAWYAGFVLYRRTAFALLDATLVHGGGLTNPRWKYAAMVLLHLAWTLIHVWVQPYQRPGRDTTAPKSISLREISQNRDEVQDSDDPVDAPGIQIDTIDRDQGSCLRSGVPLATWLHHVELVLLLLICAVSSLLTVSPPPSADMRWIRVVITLVVHVPAAVVLVACLAFGAKTAFAKFRHSRSGVTTALFMEPLLLSDDVELEQ